MAAARSAQKLLAPGGDREKAAFDQELRNDANALSDTFDVTAAALQKSWMNPVNTMLGEVIKTLAPQPFETAADRKRLDAALSRVVAAVRGSAASLPKLKQLKAKMRAVAIAEPASVDTVPVASASARTCPRGSTAEASMNRLWHVKGSENVSCEVAVKAQSRHSNARCVRASAGCSLRVRARAHTHTHSPQ
jgi:hypothetical protein